MGRVGSPKEPYRFSICVKGYTAFNEIYRDAEYRLRVRGRKSHPEQIWSALPQIADIDFGCEDFSVGPSHKVAALQPAAREQEPIDR